MSINDIENGTILISNSNSGPTYAQVAGRKTNRWGTHLVCAILADGRGFEAVSNVGEVEKLGIGWKLASQAELGRMAGYITA